MFEFKFLTFLNTCHCLILEFKNLKILIGTFFSEDELINIDNKNVDDFPFNNSEINNINDIFKDLSIVIIPNFESLKAFPYIINKFNLVNSNIKYYSTIPITQLGRAYLNEFYLNFNTQLINNTNNNNVPILINEAQIDNFLSNITMLNYNQKVNYFIEEFPSEIMFELISNNYNLGGANIIFYYFNKTILIMTDLSLINKRYPKPYDYTLLNNKIDYLIEFPDIINKSNTDSYNVVIPQILSKINTIINKNKNIKSYSNILMILDPLFILEYIDILRYKINKNVLNVYISKSINSILKYSNINLGFLNEILVNKIHDTQQPFTIEELIDQYQNFIYFSSFKDLIESDTKILDNIIYDKCPLCYMINKYSYYNGECSDLINYYNSKLDLNMDEIITINCGNIEYTTNDKVKVNKYNLNYKINTTQYNTFISSVCPKSIYSNKEVDSMEINDSHQFLYDIDQWVVVNDNNDSDNSLYYSNNFICFNTTANEINVKCKKDNSKILFYPNTATNEFHINKNMTEEEKFICLLQMNLKSYNMKVSNINKQNKITEITINNTKFNRNSLIRIILNDADNPELDIEAENCEDSVFLNTLLNQILSS